MIDVIWVLVSIGGRLLSSYVLAFVLIGLFWRILGPANRFPHRTIIIAALILTAPKAAEQMMVAARQLPQAAITAEVEAANQAFLDVFAYAATRDELHARLGSLSLDRWPANARQMVSATLSTKARRYSDIHQSRMAGRVVRSPIPAEGRVLDELRRVDDMHWTPLLEAAARGDVVNLPDLTVTEAHESWGLAVTAARAWILFAQALRETHGLDIPAFDAEAHLGTAFDWIEDLYRVMAGDITADALFERTTLVDRVVKSSSAEAADVAALQELLGTDRGFGASYTLFAWATTFVELATDRWIARAALGETPPTTLVRLNSFRSILGLPVVHDDVVSEGRASGMMPDWPGAAPGDVGRPLQAIRLEADEGLAALAASVARLSPYWAPPAITLN
jgi:hypothetical protein